MTEQGQKEIERENICCVIHSEEFLLEYSNSLESDRTKRDKIDTSKIIQYIKLLKERFSLQFINFLCICLKLSHSKRAVISDLINHSFLTNSNNKDNRTVSI